MCVCVCVCKHDLILFRFGNNPDIEGQITQSSLLRAAQTRAISVTQSLLVLHIDSECLTSVIVLTLDVVIYTLYKCDHSFFGRLSAKG